MYSTGNRLQAMIPNPQEAYVYLLKGIRSSLGVKHVSDWEGYTKTYVPTLKMLNRVGHQLAAAQAIARSHDPDNVTPIPKELQELEQRWQEAWERRYKVVSANPGRRFR